MFGSVSDGSRLSLEEAFHYLPPQRDVQETARGLQPAAKAGLCPATRLTKEPFMRGDDVNSAISRGKEKRAQGRLLPPAVASGGPSPAAPLTLSAEPEEKVAKEPPEPGWSWAGTPASQDAMRIPIPQGGCRDPHTPSAFMA